jgi:sec-independent protein translocase protein TatA
MIKPGTLEIGLILVIILIVFGVGKLPQVGAALGKSINAFKKGQSGEELDEAATAKTKKKKTKKKAVKKTASPKGTEGESAEATKSDETPAAAA